MQYNIGLKYSIYDKDTLAEFIWKCIDNNKVSSAEKCKEEVEQIVYISDNEKDFEDQLNRLNYILSDIREALDTNVECYTKIIK